MVLTTEVKGLGRWLGWQRPPRMRMKAGVQIPNTYKKSGRRGKLWPREVVTRGPCREMTSWPHPISKF